MPGLRSTLGTRYGASLLLIFLVSCSVKPSDKSRVRVVSLAPSLTEIVYALRRADDLVGVTSFCDYPIEAKQKYRVGDFSNPSLERIVALKPDLVLVNLPEQNRIKNELEKLKIRIFNSSPATVEDIIKDVQAIGQLLYVRGRGDSLADSLRNELILLGREPITNSPNIYLEISSQPLVSVGSTSYINDMLERAGGRNVFADLRVAYPVVSQEELIRRNPDLMFILHKAGMGQRLGWQNIRAVREDHVYYDLDPDLIFRPGPRIIEGIRMIHERLKEL